MTKHPADDAAAPVVVAVEGENKPIPTTLSKYDWPNLENDDGRGARLEACGWMDTPAETRFDRITALMGELFKTPVSCVTLIANDRVWFKSLLGPFGCCVSRFDAFCNYICVPPKPEVLVVEDASKDARFAHNPYVKGAPHIKFYAGAPMVGAGGTRYGTLCVIDLVPRTFTAELYHLLANFAELATQELELDEELLSTWSSQAVSDARRSRSLHACISCATDGVAFVDTRRTAWEIKYVNDKFAAAVCGGEREVDGFLGAAFWHTFRPVGSQVSFDEITATASAAGVMQLEVECTSTGARFTVVLRPASTDQMTPGKATGVPAWVPSENAPPGTKMGIDAEEVEVDARDRSRCQDVEKCFYLAIIQPGTLSYRSAGPIDNEEVFLSTIPGRKYRWSSSSIGSHDSAITAHWPLSSGSAAAYGDFVPPDDLPQLTLGPLIGSGSFGKVYRGVWEGSTVVAVKVVRCTSEDRFTRAVDEGRLSIGLCHPNVVQTYKLSAEIEDLYAAGTAGGEMRVVDAARLLWIVQEYCDRGTLIDAVERGWFRSHHSIHADIDMRALYRTLLDIAAGMEHIHANGVMHCDLNGRNVMLQLSDVDERGFVAKVCDFGLAHEIGGEVGDLVRENVLGTISHVSPEQIVEGKVVAEGDVWAFGVVMWECFTAQRAYTGKNSGTVILAISSGKGRLQLPQTAPQTYRGIMDACLQYDPVARPSFSLLTEMLTSAVQNEAGACY